jgi:hypothetical protein
VFRPCCSRWQVFGRPCQSVASLNDIEAVSAQSSPHSWRSNGPITEPFTGKLTGTPTVSGYLDADDGDGSTSSDDSSLSTEREFDADDDHHHMPIDELELALETSPSSRNRSIYFNFLCFQDSDKAPKAVKRVCRNSDKCSGQESSESFDPAA